MRPQRLLAFVSATACASHHRIALSPRGSLCAVRHKIPGGGRTVRDEAQPPRRSNEQTNAKSGLSLRHFVPPKPSHPKMASSLIIRRTLISCSSRRPVTSQQLGRMSSARAFSSEAQSPGFFGQLKEKFDPTSDKAQKESMPPS